MSRFGGSPLALAAGVVFTTILVIAAIGDLRTRRISNRTVALLGLLGFAFSISASPVLGGLRDAGGGFLVGLACWLPFYVFGWLGAGDVKLYAAAGAWLGPLAAVEGALVGALFGAGLSILWMVKSRGLKNTVDTIGLAAGSPGILSPGTSEKPDHATLPYGIAIAFGAIWAAWMPQLLRV